MEGKPGFATTADLQQIAKKMAIVAVGVSVMCVAVILLANRKNKPGSDGRQIHVVETVTLAPRCFCDLIDVKGQFFVVARDATGLKNIRPISSFPNSMAEFTDDAQSSFDSKPSDSLATI